MRLSVDQIKEAIVHPEREVRIVSLAYFQDSLSTDATIMPHLIEAVRRYGWDEACSPFKTHRPLKQTEETVGWLLEQLARPAPDPERERLWMCWQRFLSWQLIAAPVELLVPHAGILDGLVGLDAGCRYDIQERLPLASADPETGWRELEKFCEESVAAFDDIEFADDDFNRFCEAIVRGGDRFADRVLELVSQPPADSDDDAKCWMQAAATQLAGLMRLTAAVPSLVNRLEEDIDNDGQWNCERCADALIRIGTDDVLREIARRFPQSSWDFRALSTRVLEGIHSESSLRAGLELMSRESDGTLKSYLGKSLLHQFDLAAIEPVRDCILRGHCDDDEDDMIRRLVAVTTLMDVTIPESVPWRERAAEASEESREYFESRLTEDGRLPDDWDSEWEEMERMYGALDEEDLDDDEDLEDDEDDEYDVDDLDDDDFEQGFADLLDDPTVEADDLPRSIRADPKVGRNDPCPCGSGKKFKKCCLNRQKNPPNIEW